MLYVRKAAEGDLERIAEIYRYAQDFMIRTGNPTQWGHFHPDPELIRSDISGGISRVIYDENGIHGVFAVCEGTEPSYARIDDGEWPNDEPYVTIHRIAGDGEVRGIFTRAACYCKSLSKNVRVDTHADNKIMQRAAESNGFKRCGIIYVREGSPRLAYQWTAEAEERK